MTTQYRVPPPPIYNDANDFVWHEYHRQVRDLLLKDNILNRISWNSQDGTLDISMDESDVTQQVGLEQYMVILNNTGSLITNGTIVGFSGASNGRITAAPYLANSTTQPLFFIGVATQDIPNNTEGYVTTYGYVRDINTSSWSVGDILYASPTVSGAMTNVKPTAPNAVVPVAAVLKSSATEGVIIVRPTITLENPYGVFSDKTNQTAAAINTPYAVTFNTTEFSDGHSRGTPTSRIVAATSGLYNYQFSLQLVSTNASAKDVYIWARKNGTDIPDTSTRISVTGNGVYFVASWNFVLSLNANDYFELMWATTDTAVSITAPAATAFCPAIPSALLSVTTVAL